MTIKELIDQLKELPVNNDVFIWVDGNRYSISLVDDNLDGNYVDINAEINQ